MPAEERLVSYTPAAEPAARMPDARDISGAGGDGASVAGHEPGLTSRGAP